MNLPKGYRLRLATDRDLSSLSAILGSAFAEPFDEGWVQKTLYEDATIDEIWLVESDSGASAATATARHIPEQPDVGYVHYVGVHPDHQGRSLGYWASLAVLHAFMRLGKLSAILDTDDFRIPAIRTYIRLGFEPLMSHESHPERWAAIQKSLS